MSSDQLTSTRDNSLDEHSESGAVEPRSISSDAVEPNAVEPDAIEPQASSAHQRREMIRPKLIKRDGGVRLTEVRREGGGALGPRAPRGTGALAETEAVSELRRARAIKRAAELINTVSEEMELSERLSRGNRELIDKARRAARELSRAEVDSSQGSSDHLSSHPSSEPLTDPSLRDDDRAPLEVSLASVELSDDLLEPSWELDQDTLRALESLESLEVSPLTDSLSSDLSPDLSPDLSSDLSSGLSPGHSSSTDTYPRASGELSAQDFLSALDPNHALPPIERSSSLDNRGAVEPRGEATQIQSDPRRPVSHSAARHTRQGSGETQRSETQRSETQRSETQRGQVVWTRFSPQEVASSQGANLDTQSHQATYQGWRLDRLQNKIEGAETWVGSRVNGGPSDDAASSQVVIKIVWPHVLSENPMMWQFDAEVQVRALQQLNHPTIPNILAWGEDERLGAWVTVTEWVEGVSLAAHLKRGALSVDDALKLFMPLAEGLAQCHLEGLLHRKVQPTHIIITPSGPRLISFQWVGGGTGEDIQRGQQGAYQLFNQRPKFLAPEWMRDSLITDRVDVYGLGACLLDAVAPQAESWRDAPPQLHIALSGALHPAASERSEITELISDLSLSRGRYLYQAGNETSPDIPAETLSLHEVISRIRVNELGWHLLARRSTREGERARALEPWGNFEEVVSALERAARYQDATPAVIGGDELPAHHLEELERRAESLNARESQLKRLEEELTWRDQALRARERELNERDAALQEESARVDQLREAVQLREDEIKERQAALNERRDELTLLSDELSQRHDDLESRSAALRVSEEELAREVAAQAHELELLKATLESESARARAAVRAEEEALNAQLDARARALIEERERALEEARRAAAEERARAEAERAAATQELERERARHRDDLAEREARRVALEDEESAFARGGMQRAHQQTHQQARRAPEVHEPDELTYREFEVEGVTLRARYCPPGVGWFGDESDDAKPEERPRHRAKLTRGFWLAEVPVTQGQWSALMESNPSTTLGLNHPVEGVEWVEAALFCNALSEAFGFEQAYEVEGALQRARHRAHIAWREDASGFRLPTEAEWEYAARSGLSGQRHRYALGESLDEVGWYTQNSGGATHPVGLKAPNQWGLYDMSGSVWEWCHDEWRRDAYRERMERGLIDPVVYNPRLTPRVIRGGAWYDFASACRLSARPGQDVSQGYGIGFRICLPHTP